MASSFLALVLAAGARAAPRLDPVDAVARANPCKSNADCFITPHGCGVKAVNAANRPTPEERRKASVAICRGVVLDDAPKAVCVEKLCRVAWTPKKKSTRAPVK